MVIILIFFVPRHVGRHTAINACRTTYFEDIVPRIQGTRLIDHYARGLQLTYAPFSVWINSRCGYLGLESSEQ